jgi:hypothetical protein
VPHAVPAEAAKEKASAPPVTEDADDQVAPPLVEVTGSAFIDEPLAGPDLDAPSHDGLDTEAAMPAEPGPEASPHPSTGRGSGGTGGAGLTDQAGTDQAGADPSGADPSGTTVRVDAGAGDRALTADEPPTGEVPPPDSP